MMKETGSDSSFDGNKENYFATKDNKNSDNSEDEEENGDINVIFFPFITIIAESIIVWGLWYP